jgi:hypothetical protein
MQPGPIDDSASRQGGASDLQLHLSHQQCDASPDLEFHYSPPHHASIFFNSVPNSGATALVSTPSSTPIDLILRARIELLP